MIYLSFQTEIKPTILNGQGYFTKKYKFYEKSMSKEMCIKTYLLILIRSVMASVGRKCTLLYLDEGGLISISSLGVVGGSVG